jgi:hypothetical protein
MKLTIEHVLELIEVLPTNKVFDYVSGGDSKAKLISVDKQNLKVDIVRVNADETEKNASMTTDILITLSNSIKENIPFKFDNVLNGSGNVRSTMEAIFAHTSEFYSCKIGRVKHLIWVPRIPHEIGKIVDYDLIKDKMTEILKNETEFSNQPLQIIFYGAPGTGKSHEIKEKTKGKSVIRTTFHPDSDYSTFVGAYKPTMEDAETMVVPVVVNNGISLQEKGIFIEKRIVYKFIMQAFLKAYLGAWKKYADRKSDEVEPQFLVIEEINRGNCAQIFGDLFQLLDRNDEHFSEYPIESDTDLQKEIERAFKEHKNYKLEHDIEVEDIIEDYTSNYDSTLSEDIQHGRVLLLPPNLYIWATMNTSDQSLFPIDSAFKRRWEWVYQPIDTAKETWYVKVGENHYSWTAFLNKVNDELLTDETAEDKHLGFYFCKATEKKAGTETKPNVITAETFVGKVLFYLWNDVFKVYGIPSSIGSSKDWPYRKFYQTNGEVDKEKVAKLMTQLKIDTDAAEELQPEEE